MSSITIPNNVVREIFNKRHSIMVEKGYDMSFNDLCIIDKILENKTIKSYEICNWEIDGSDIPYYFRISYHDTHFYNDWFASLPVSEITLLWYKRLDGKKND